MLLLGAALRAVFTRLGPTITMIEVLYILVTLIYTNIISKRGLSRYEDISNMFVYANSVSECVYLPLSFSLLDTSRLSSPDKQSSQKLCHRKTNDNLHLEVILLCKQRSRLVLKRLWEQVYSRSGLQDRIHLLER